VSCLVSTFRGDVYQEHVVQCVYKQTFTNDAKKFQATPQHNHHEIQFMMSFVGGDLLANPSDPPHLPTNLGPAIGKMDVERPRVASTSTSSVTSMLESMWLASRNANESTTAKPGKCLDLPSCAFSAPKSNTSQPTPSADCFPNMIQDECDTPPNTKSKSGPLQTEWKDDKEAAARNEMIRLL
jgi:hypothetical protein